MTTADAFGVDKSGRPRRRGMSCSCVLGDDGMPIKWCAAHARVVRKHVEDEREACAKIADGYADPCGSRDERDILMARSAASIAEEIRDRNSLEG